MHTDVKACSACHIRFTQRWEYSSQSELTPWKDWVPVTHTPEMNWTETACAHLLHLHAARRMSSVCVCVCETVALPCQNATCSSWLQLNGKLEILTIDLVVHKWLGNVSQGGGGYLTFHHPAWRHIYRTEGLSIQPPPLTHTSPFSTCSPPSPAYMQDYPGKRQHRVSV